MKYTTMIAFVLSFTGGLVAGEEVGKSVRASRFLTESVVYAEVASVTHVSPSNVRVTLNVKSTLTGPYDAATRPLLHADMPLFRRWEITAREPPKPKARVVVLLRSQPEPFFVPWHIPFGDVAYTRDGSAIVEVSGFDDPKVAEIIARLREVRKEAKGKQASEDAGLPSKAAPARGADPTAATAKMREKMREAAADLVATVEKPKWLVPQQSPLVEFRREVLRGLQSVAASEGGGLDAHFARRIAIHLLGVWRDTEASYDLSHRIGWAPLLQQDPPEPLGCYPAAQALVEIGSPALKVIFEQRMAQPVTDQELRILAWVIYLIDGRDLGLARVELKVSELSRSYPRTRLENVSRLLEIYKSIDFKDKAQWPRPLRKPPEKAKQGSK